MADAAPAQSTEFSPLQVPLVLKTIFEGSSLDDVKEFRKVCRSWNLESSKLLMKSAQLEFGAFRRREPDITPNKFMALVDNELCVFTRKDSFPESVFLNLAEYDARFWRRFGSHIKNLNLGGVTFPHVNDFCEVIFHSSPNLENLEMTWIRILGVDGDFNFSSEEENSAFNQDAKADNDSNNYPQRGNKAVNKTLKLLRLGFTHEYFPGSLFKRLFNHFPNLEALYVTFCTKESSSAIFSALKDWILDGDGRAENLKEVGLRFADFENPNEMAEILTSGKLRLEKLELLEFTSYNDANAAQRILEGHAGTLKKLKLQGYGFDDGQQPVFPLSNGVILGELEEMTLTVTKLESTNLWKSVPNLKKLVLRDVCLSDVVSAVSIQELRNVAVRNCVEVQLENCFSWDVEDEAEAARKLAVLLPNVQKLKLQDGDFSPRIVKVFSTVWVAFPKLVELRISSEHSGPSLDSAITGLEGKVVKKINREGRNGDWKRKSVRRAGLAKLKDLKVLSIRCVEGLGYSSAVAGIQRLPQLQQLQLDFKEVNEEDWSEVWMPLLAQFP